MAIRAPVLTGCKPQTPQAGHGGQRSLPDGPAKPWASPCSSSLPTPPPPQPTIHTALLGWNHVAQMRSMLGRGPVLPSVPNPSRPTSAPWLHLPAQLRPLVWPTDDPDRDLLLLGSVWPTPLLWAAAEEWLRLGWGEAFSVRPPSALPAPQVPQVPKCPPWARGADCDTPSLQSPPAFGALGLPSPLSEEGCPPPPPFLAGEGERFLTVPWALPPHQPQPHQGPLKEPGSLGSPGSSRGFVHKASDLVSPGPGGIRM